MTTNLVLDMRYGSSPFPLLLVLRANKSVITWSMGIKLTSDEWNQDTQTAKDHKLNVLIRSKRLVENPYAFDPGDHFYLTMESKLQ